MSIISAFAIMGIWIVILFLMSMVIFFQDDYASFAAYFAVFFLVLLVYLFDFLTFGLLRRIPYFSYLLFPFFKFYDFLSLRKYYQRSLWLFNTNIKKLRLTIYALIFAFASFSLAFNSIHHYMYWKNIFDLRQYNWHMADNTYLADELYMDGWDEKSNYIAGLSSKIQHGNYLELFVRYSSTFDGLIKESSEKRSEQYFGNVLEVSIDDSSVTNLEWYPTRKLNKSVIGVTTMIPIYNIENGAHILTVYTDTIQGGEIKQGEQFKVEIPFWVDK